MESLKITGTPNTPYISFDGQTGLLEIKGRSIPANAVEFYSAALEWITAYAEQPLIDTKMIIHLDYFNTSSSKTIWEVLKALERIQLSGKSNVLLEWHYEKEDDDLRDAAIEYQDILKIRIELVEVDED